MFDYRVSTSTTSTIGWVLFALAAIAMICYMIFVIKQERQFTKDNKRNKAIRLANPFPTRSVDESPYIQHDFRLELQLLEEEYMLDMDTQGAEANEDIIDLFTQEEIIRIVRKDS